MYLDSEVFLHGQKQKRKWKSQGGQEVVVPNVLTRDFFAANPNEKWVTDISYV